MLPNRFFGGVPKYPFRTLIPARDDAIKVLTYNGIIRGGYDSSQKTRYFLCLLRLVHILWRRLIHLRLSSDNGRTGFSRELLSLSLPLCPMMPNTVNTVGASNTELAPGIERDGELLVHFR